MCRLCHPVPSTSLWAAVCLVEGWRPHELRFGTEGAVHDRERTTVPTLIVKDSSDTRFTTTAPPACLSFSFCKREQEVQAAPPRVMLSRAPGKDEDGRRRLQSYCDPWDPTVIPGTTIELQEGIPTVVPHLSGKASPVGDHSRKTLFACSQRRCPQALIRQTSAAPDQGHT